MIKNATKILFLALIATACGAYAAQPAKPKAPPKPVQPAKVLEREIPYADLGHFVGQRIIVHSALGTVRSGTLTHYSQSQIDIALEGSGAQLTFARDGIRNVGVPIEPEEPQGGDSAKKN